MCIANEETNKIMNRTNISYVPGRISVIMPCFDAEAHLEESINSVLNQSYGNIELFVIDDGSTDRSGEILDSFGVKLTVISQENLGPGPARNRGIERASGEFIAFLDADDYWDSDCLTALYTALKDSNVVLAYSGWQNVGVPANRSKPYIPPDYEKFDKAERFLQAAAPWPIHAALVRHEILKELGGFDEQWSTCMDYDLWLRIGTRWPIVRVEKVLAFYRHHGATQITSRQWMQAQNVLSVKLHFIEQHPERVAHLTSARIRELTYGAYLQRGFDSYWKRDLVSAHKIFRRCLVNGYFRPKDIKYLLPSVLPEKLFTRLVNSLDGNQD